MDTLLKNSEERMKKSVAALDADFASIRTGRASATLFDKIKVDYYGQQTPLAQAATISIPESRLVVIQPWDRGLLGAIEKALMASELSLNPSNDGKVIRIQIPPLTEERRKELVKLAKSHAEQGKVSIRNIRRDANDGLKKLLKEKEIGEDQEKQGEDKVQKLTDTYVAKVDELLKKKEAEIMEE